MRYEKVRNKKIIGIVKKNMKEAIRENNLKTVETILEKYSYAHFASMNLLHEAVGNSRYELVRTLIEKGIDVHQKGDYGETPLMKAVNIDEYELGELFVSRGMSLAVKDQDGENVFDWLEEEGTENTKKWMEIFMKNQEHMDEESLRVLKAKRLELLF